MLQVYTGNGKGKTTSAIGLVMRALGHNMKVFIIQFFKDKNFYGEQNILRKLKNVKIFSFAPKHPCFYKNVKIRLVESECKKAVDLIEKVFKERKCDLLVLDEFNNAICGKFMDIKKIVCLLKNRPKNMEVIITGRNAPKQLLKIADLVSEIKEIKHPYKKGVKCRKGIEY
ncbi:MAG: hypothetical protein A2474_08715 [Elusimicrobia bacterium RIFOXYC2_FULL_34_12]|nr:MAG: hypothetical protein A2474_08715 [Elusimicrobia bacterium RIFOXYC2_FULL_34_12]OGS39782.1 MAG: hypothetical protein A2551_02585 [Elusimicrobia bacterium RIFOXYD2_FULL_34_30]